MQKGKVASFEQKPVYVSQVPIKKPTTVQETEVTQNVNKMLQLNARLFEIGDKLTDERTRIKDEIKKTDSEIDNAIYRLPSITDAEKEIIENTIKQS